MRTKKLILLALALFSLAVTGVTTSCNTVEGAGRDVESVGEGMQDAAD